LVLIREDSWLVCRFFALRERHKEGIRGKDFVYIPSRENWSSYRQRRRFAH